mgnify:CR=1 FL=1
MNEWMKPKRINFCRIETIIQQFDLREREKRIFFFISIKIFYFVLFFQRKKIEFRKKRENWKLIAHSQHIYNFCNSLKIEKNGIFFYRLCNIPWNKYSIEYDDDDVDHQIHHLMKKQKFWGLAKRKKIWIIICHIQFRIKWWLWSNWN